MNTIFKIVLIFLTLNTLSFSQSSYFVKVSSHEIKSIYNYIKNISDNYFQKSGANSLIIKPLYPFNLDDNLNIFIISGESKTTNQLVINELINKDLIEYYQEIRTLKIDQFPNDSLYGEQWGLKNIQFDKIHESNFGSKDVLIGIIDTGIDKFHLDLSSQIFKNQGEIGIDEFGNDKSQNGIDDDKNGFIDDYEGWDFTDRTGFPYDPGFGDYLEWDNNPTDENGHGTNVAGIIGASRNNLIGISGIASGSQILNLRAFDKNGEGEEDDVASAILYALNMGVKVINMSFGDDSYSIVLKEVIDYAYSKGMTFIGSSGNSSSDLPHYPSSYNAVIAVGASNKSDAIASFSNYGSTIDLVAPGVDIITTEIGNKYKAFSGTSAAAPFVTAAVALLLSQSPDLTSAEIKQILKTTSDDIDYPGWDLKSGAGRLNIFRAMNIKTPSQISIDYPKQDFSTDDDTLSIFLTVLAASFKNYSLWYGTGYNPEIWIELTSGSQYQLLHEKVYNLDISNFQDSCYTLRLSVEFTNGFTSEERVNFYVDRTPSEAELIFIKPSYFGEASTIVTSVYTNEKSTVKMFYREKGSQEFNFISLDGLATNNFFVKQNHYGFLPKYIAQPNTVYEIFFEVQNQTGLISYIKDGDAYFEAKTDRYFNPASLREKDYSLPAGRLFPETVSITSNELNEVFLNQTNENGYFAFLYNIYYGSFSKIDSIKNKRPKSVGDFNNDDKIDLLNLFSRGGYIDQQEERESSKFINIFSDTSGSFWPILASDIDNDNLIEVLTIDKNDFILNIWELDSNLQPGLEIQLTNFSTADNTGLFGQPNVFGQPNAVIDKIGGTDKAKIWMVDREGDIISFNIDGTDSYSNGESIRTYFSGEKGILASGDYDGDGNKELAVLLESVSEFDIAPFNLLLVFNFLGDSLNIIFTKTFIDPSESFLPQQFATGGSCVRFIDLDYDGRDEIVLLAFPYSYIIQKNYDIDVIIHYDENTNFELNEAYKNIFFGDLDKNGINELAMPKEDKIVFYEFADQNRPDSPVNLTGFGIDGKSVKISWDGNSPLYYIYKSEGDEPRLLDSTSFNEYIDTAATFNEWYKYYVSAVDYNFENPVSAVSNELHVYSHQPAKSEKIEYVGARNIRVTFSEKIRKTIENLGSFILDNSKIPGTAIAASEYSYLLTFEDYILPGDHQLIIKNLSDFYNSPIAGDTLYFNAELIPESESFFVSSFNISDSHNLKIVFNLPVDRLSALNISNYIMRPDNTITNIELNNQNPSMINLTFKNPMGSIGREYVLSISKVYSSESSGKILINEGAGSYILLSSFSSNLSDVYVYPNPADCSSDEKITFANLTKNVEINIYSINGKRVKTLVENDGNGGIDWDFKDENGSIIGSGVYIYTVKSFDDSGNRTDEIIKKFAVTK